MTNQINAFHPDYCKTYMPEFITSIRLESRQTKAGQTLSRHVDKKRETVPSHGTINGISKNPLPIHQMRPKEMMKRPILTKKQQSMTMQEVTAELIENLKTKGKK
jgi:hypothetical protein